MIPCKGANGKMDEGTIFEFHQPNKQTESKMQVTGKLLSNKIKLERLWECSDK